jgi:hypothetical protein
MDVMAGLERACLMTSAATKPVEPATTSFILSVAWWRWWLLFVFVFVFVFEG